MITIGIICMMTILLMSGAAFVPLALGAMVVLLPLMAIFFTVGLPLLAMILGLPVGV